MSTIKAPLNLKDLDLRAARVLTFVKFFNYIISVGILLTGLCLGLDKVKNLILRGKLKEDDQYDKFVENVELNGFDDISTTSTVRNGAKTGKTSYTLASSEIQKLIDENLTTKLYKDQGSMLQNEVCGICSKKYKPRSKIKTLPDCEHYFHAKCLSDRIKKNERKCPKCAKDFTETLVGSYLGDATGSAKTTNVTVNTAGTTDFVSKYYQNDVEEDEDADDVVTGASHQKN